MGNICKRFYLMGKYTFDIFFRIDDTLMVNIYFQNRNLEKLYTNGRSKKYPLPQQIIDSFFEVLAILEAAKDINDSQTNERSGTNKLVPFPRESEQPKVVSGVCNANSKAERFTVQSRTQGTIPLPLKQLRSFQRNRTAKAVLGPGLALGYDTFHFRKQSSLNFEKMINTEKSYSFRLNRKYRLEVITD